jgi:branched-chain amino acid transport system permease protein
MSQVLVNGVFIGLVYALFGLGLVVVYNGSGRINFAHGEIGMMGAFVFAIASQDRGWPVPIAILGAVALSALLGVITERLVARPLGGQSPLTTMLGTFGIGTFLLVIASEVFGGGLRVQPPLIDGAPVEIGGLLVTRHHLLAGTVAISLFALVELLYRRTRLGSYLRAIAMDPAAAQVIGLPVNACSMFAWGLAGALAAIAGILISPVVTFSVGFMSALLVRGVSALVLGGFNRAFLVAGAALAIAELEAVIQLESSTAGLTEMLLALTIVGVLVARPGPGTAQREATA